MFDSTDLLGEAIEQGQQAAKQIAAQPKAFANTAAKQVAGGVQDQGTNEQATKSATHGQPGQSQASFDRVQDNPQDRSAGEGQDFQKQQKEFLHDLYGSSTNAIPQNAKGDEKKTANFIQQLTILQHVDDAQELAKKRAELEQLKKIQHKQSYYDPTFHPPKPKEEAAAEKVEREEEEEKKKKQMKVLEEQKKQEVPIAVQQANQKAERFRGVSG